MATLYKPKPVLMKPSDFVRPLDHSLLSPATISEWAAAKTASLNVTTQGSQNILTFNTELDQGHSSVMDQAIMEQPQVTTFGTKNEPTKSSERPKLELTNDSMTCQAETEIKSTNLDKHRQKWEREFVNSNIHDDITAQLMRSQTKLRENRKILKAYADGEFPVQKSKHKVEHTQTINEASIKSESMHCHTTSVKHYVNTLAVSNSTRRKETGEKEERTNLLSLLSRKSNGKEEVKERGRLSTYAKPMATLSGSSDNSWEMNWLETQAYNDTSNDEAIALALQEEIEKSHSGSSVYRQTGQSATKACRSHKQEKIIDEDYHIARKMQESYDQEMAQAMQQSTGDTYIQHTSNNAYAEPFEQIHPAPIPEGQPRPSSLHHCNESTIRVPSSSTSLVHHGLYSGHESTPVADSDMSYEALSELEDVPSGFTSTEISRLTRTYKYLETLSDKSCGICLSDYTAGQVLRCLPCFHNFHRHCIDKWLFEKRTCPVCLKSIE